MNEKGQMMLSDLIKELVEQLKSGDKFIGFEDEDTNVYTSYFKIKTTNEGDLLFII